MPKKKFLYILAGVAVLMGGIGFFANHQGPSSLDFRCPEEYRSEEEYIAETGRLLSEYIEVHPGASQEETMAARQAMFDARGCKGWEAASWYGG